MTDDEVKTKDLGPLEFKAEDVAIVVGRIYDVYDHTPDKKLDKLCTELLNTLLAGRLKENCPHPGCCCVCGHQGKCPEDGPSIVEGIHD